MADYGGGFNTFDLGHVIATAEGIKQMRNQSKTDMLREQFMGEQIQTEKYNRERQQKADQVVLGKDKASQIVAKTGQILQQEDPKGYIEQYEPVLAQQLHEQLSADGFDWQTADANVIKQHVSAIQNRANQELGVAPIESQEIGGGTVLTQGGQWRGSFGSKNAGAKSPQSWEEYTLAQKDPEFRKFLESRRGKGLSITTPDGTVVEMGGASGAVGPSELAKPTINNLQETIVNSSNRLDRVNSLLSTYKPEYLRAKGLVKAGASEIKDFLGMDLKPEEKQFLQGYSEFKANASQEFSATLKELSGSAASEGEVARVMKGVPTDKDKSPEVFEAKAKATTKFITRALMRANWALKNGIGVQSVDDLSKRMPLEGIDGVYEARANQIWQEMGGTPETKKQAVQKANEEFGLAR